MNDGTTEERVSTDPTSYYRDGIHLWRAVIFRAQLEAEGKYKPTTEEKETLEELIRDGRRFLTVDSQDLRIVVHLAQLPMLYQEFLMEMKKRYGMPDA